MKISTVLDQIDLGSIALPEFQRGYVWNRNQVRELMHSLYHRYPIGSLLIWVTKTEFVDTRGNGILQPGTVKLLLDGQQRITTLYGIIRGKPPEFFDGNAQTFNGLHFNIEEEVFEFYAPVKMKDDPMWFDVTEIMKIGPGKFINTLTERPEYNVNLAKYLNNLNSIYSIKDIDLHIEEVTGEDKTVDVVVDIFNKVNSVQTLGFLSRFCGKESGYVSNSDFHIFVSNSLWFFTIHNFHLSFYAHRKRFLGRV